MRVPRPFLFGVALASVLIDMVARQDFEHDGRTYASGECFQCPPIHAAVLKYRHKAEFAKVAQRDERENRSTYRRRDLRAER